MKIRKATFNDLDQLTKLFDQYLVFYELDSDVIQAKLFLADRITKGESEIFVAENNEGELVGFVQLYPLFSSTRMKKLWLLNDLYVNETFRSQHISVMLIEKAKDLCIQSGSCGMMLETAKSNKIGNALYPKTGFELDSYHNYYSWDC